jgi:hypothetical protein
MSIFDKISKLVSILISSVLIQKFGFLFKLQQLKFFSTIFFQPKKSLFPNPFHFGNLFDLHNSIRSKQTFGPTGPNDCLPPRVNQGVIRLRLSATTAHCHAATSSSHPSVWETRTTSCAPFPSRNPSFILLETEVLMYRRKIFGLVT